MLYNYNLCEIYKKMKQIIRKYSNKLYQIECICCLLQANINKQATYMYFVYKEWISYFSLQFLHNIWFSKI